MNNDLFDLHENINHEEFSKILEKRMKECKKKYPEIAIITEFLFFNLKQHQDEKDEEIEELKQQIICLKGITIGLHESIMKIVENINMICLQTNFVTKH